MFVQTPQGRAPMMDRQAASTWVMALVKSFLSPMAMMAAAAANLGPGPSLAGPQVPCPPGQLLSVRGPPPRALCCLGSSLRMLMCHCHIRLHLCSLRVRVRLLGMEMAPPGHHPSCLPEQAPWGCQMQGCWTWGRCWTQGWCWTGTAQHPYGISVGTLTRPRACEDPSLFTACSPSPPLAGIGLGRVSGLDGARGYQNHDCCRR